MVKILAVSWWGNPVKAGKQQVIVFNHCGALRARNASIYSSQMVRATDAHGSSVALAPQPAAQKSCASFGDTNSADKQIIFIIAI